jgi:hypothetical protein
LVSTKPLSLEEATHTPTKAHTATKLLKTAAAPAASIKHRENCVMKKEPPHVRTVHGLGWTRLD